jgi:Domain of unknown function (DUF4399)
MTPFSAFRRSLLLAAMIGVASTALAQTPPASPPATPPAAAPAAPPPPKVVYFINLKDGQTVTSPFKIQFGLSGMGVAPAGVDKPNTGHHHLLIDTTLSADQMKGAIPMDAQHLHFGGGQTETMVTLPPGKHTLQLELANWSHIPFDPPVQSPVITVNVQGPEAAKSSTKSSAKSTHAHHAHHRHHRHTAEYMQQ